MTTDLDAKEIAPTLKASIGYERGFEDSKIRVEVEFDCADELFRWLLNTASSDWLVRACLSNPDGHAEAVRLLTSQTFGRTMGDEGIEKLRDRLLEDCERGAFLTALRKIAEACRLAEDIKKRFADIRHYAYAASTGDGWRELYQITDTFQERINHVLAARDEWEKALNDPLLAAVKAYVESKGTES